MHICTSLMPFIHPSSCSSIRTKCKEGAPSPPTISALHTAPPSFPPCLHPSSLPSFLPFWGLLCYLSHGADMSACLLWYSSIRSACWPRSGTNNPSSTLIIIRDINKFGWKTTPWTLNLYPPLKLIFLLFWWQNVSLPKRFLSPRLLQSLLRVCNKSIRWMRYMLPLYICRIERCCSMWEKLSQCPQKKRKKWYIFNLTWLYRF